MLSLSFPVVSKRIVTSFNSFSSISVLSLNEFKMGTLCSSSITKACTCDLSSSFCLLSTISCFFSIPMSPYSFGIADTDVSELTVLLIFGSSMAVFEVSSSIDSFNFTHFNSEASTRFFRSSISSKRSSLSLSLKEED